MKYIIKAKSGWVQKLESKHPGATWHTIHGRHVLVHGGNVLAYKVKPSAKGGMAYKEKKSLKDWHEETGLEHKEKEKEKKPKLVVKKKPKLVAKKERATRIADKIAGKIKGQFKEEKVTWKQYDETKHPRHQVGSPGTAGQWRVKALSEYNFGEMEDVEKLIGNMQVDIDKIPPLYVLHEEQEDFDSEKILNVNILKSKSNDLFDALAYHHSSSGELINNLKNNFPLTYLFTGIMDLPSPLVNKKTTMSEIKKIIAFKKTKEINEIMYNDFVEGFEKKYGTTIDRYFYYRFPNKLSKLDQKKYKTITEMENIYGVNIKFNKMPYKDVEKMNKTFNDLENVIPDFAKINKDGKLNIKFLGGKGGFRSDDGIVNADYAGGAKKTISIKATYNESLAHEYAHYIDDYIESIQKNDKLKKEFNKFKKELVSNSGLKSRYDAKHYSDPEKETRGGFSLYHKYWMTEDEVFARFMDQYIRYKSPNTTAAEKIRKGSVDAGYYFTQEEIKKFSKRPLFSKLKKQKLIKAIIRLSK